MLEWLIWLSLQAFLSSNAASAVAGVTDGNIAQFNIKGASKKIELSMRNVMTVEKDTFMVSNAEYFPYDPIFSIILEGKSIFLTKEPSRTKKQLSAPRQLQLRN